MALIRTSSWISANFMGMRLVCCPRRCSFSPGIYPWLVGSRLDYSSAWMSLFFLRSRCVKRWLMHSATGTTPKLEEPSAWQFTMTALRFGVPGAFPLASKVEDLKREHLSRPRNPLIAEVFYRRGLVERWGRGTQKIVELCLRAGHPEPEFLEVAGAVGVRFLP